MEQSFEKTAEQAAAFQKMWVDSAGKMFQAAFTVTPNSPPPEILKQIRSGILTALAQSWDEFMRSPQFLDAMKQWMEQAITFRKMTTDFLTKMRNDVQAPTRDDTDSLMLNIRHMEKRVLDRLDELSAAVDTLKQGGNRKSQASPGSKAARRKSRGGRARAKAA
jgi:hypothetical protein